LSCANARPPRTGEYLSHFRLGRVYRHVAAQGISVGSASPTGDYAAAANKQARIAFARDGQIYVINADGSGLKLLQIRPNVKPNCEEGPCTFEWSSPAWSPNGKRLALSGFVENGTLDGDNRVYIRDMNGRTTVVFVSDIGAGGVSWSPDGVWLAHDTGRDWPTPRAYAEGTLPRPERC
jgi:WD40 repeat protein